MKNILYIVIFISGILVYDQDNGNYILYCNTSPYTGMTECFKGNA